MVCVSYLAYAELWTVPTYPKANYGTEIRSLERSIAADGPMAAAALASMGAPVRLITNPIGKGEPGQFVKGWLRERHVTECAVDMNITTPRIVVAADSHHTRTWFAHLPGVAEQLAVTDLASIAEASFLYIDAYELLGSAMLQAVRVGKAAAVPLLLNLGGSPLSEQVRQALADYPNLYIQTNVDDAEYATASAVAAELRDATDAAWVILTAGVEGSVAVSQTEVLSAPAISVEVRHTHCAGASYSAGLIYGLRAGWPMEQCMLLGSASGALRCAREQSAAMPRLEELVKLVRTSQTEGLRESA
ncbi:carbohydrate kinase family protein [Nocardia niigatensis]